MSDKTLAWIAALASVASLVITYKVAMGLQKASTDIERTKESLNEGPIGAIAKIAGIKF